MPYQRRVPKRGFTAFNKKVYQTVNVGDLDERCEANSTVDPETLMQKGLVKKASQPIKILAKGELSKALNIMADSFSSAAKAKIEAAGGTAEVR